MGDDGGVLHMALLANPAARAGRAAADLDRVLARLRTHGIQPAVLTADSPAEAATAARQAVEGGLERLLVLGGDGVMHLAAGAVAATPTVRGVIPAGTGNDFARALGLLDGGLDVNVLADSGRKHPTTGQPIRTTALIEAVYSNPEAVVRLRLDRGAPGGGGLRPGQPTGDRSAGFGGRSGGPASDW